MAGYMGFRNLRRWTESGRDGGRSRGLTPAATPPVRSRFRGPYRRRLISRSTTPGPAIGQAATRVADARSRAYEKHEAPLFEVYGLGLTHKHLPEIMKAPASPAARSSFRPWVISVKACWCSCHCIDLLPGAP